MTDVTTLKTAGNSANRVDIVLVAEGYTAAERDKFLSDSQKFNDYLFNATNKATNDPFYTYRSFFNVYAAYTASQQSGYDANNVFVNTAFDAAAYLADGRLVYGDTTKVQNFVNSLFAPNQQEMIVVLVNSDKYGGAGGSVAWTTAGNPSSFDIAVHEIGHSYARLQDEYIDTAIANNYPLSALATSVHVAATNDPAQVPWKEWMGFTDSLGTVGTYEGGYYRATGVWRATQNSKMLSLNAPFNAPEKEQFVNRFYDSVNDYTTLAKTSLINVKATTPDDSLFAVTWSVAGAAASAQGTLANLETYIRGLADGARSFTLTATVSDATGLIRKAAVIANAQDVKTVAIELTKTTLGAGNDSFTTAGNGFVLAAGGNDRIDITGGSNFVDGGIGTDTVIYRRTKADYTITSNADGSNTIVDKVSSSVDILVGVELLQFSDQTFSLSTDVPFPTLFATNLSQGKAIAAAYQTLLGGTPAIAGYEFLIKGNVATNFGAGSGANFNDENIFINVANSLVQGNATAAAKFATLAAGTTLSEKITSLYSKIIPAAKQSADGVAFLTRPDGLKFYQDVAKERGITAENGPAVIALASLLKVAVDSKIGIGNPVSDLIASIADGSSGVPATSAAVLPIETVDGTKFDADDAPDAMPGFSGPPPAPLIGIGADEMLAFA